MPEPSIVPGEAAHQEIAELERLLAEKKQTLSREGKPFAEREVFREAFHEKYGEQLPGAVASGGILPHALPPQPTTPSAGDAVKTAEREAQIKSLIELALVKGVRAATNLARHASPWLLDELHDRLQDAYYEKLVQLKQIKPL